VCGGAAQRRRAAHRQVPDGARQALEGGQAHDVLVLISEVWGRFSPEAMRFLGDAS